MDPTTKPSDSIEPNNPFAHIFVMVAGAVALLLVPIAIARCRDWAIERCQGIQWTQRIRAMDQRARVQNKEEARAESAERAFWTGSAGDVV